MTVALFFLLCGVVLGIAGQYLVTLAALIPLSWASGFQPARLNEVDWQVRRSFLLAAGFVAAVSIGSLLNPVTSFAQFWKQIVGYSYWVVFPVAMVIVFRGEARRLDWRWIARTCLLIVSFVWALLAVWQVLDPWKIVGSSVVAHDEYRPCGLYSHPLTFAYAAPICWPLALVMLRRNLADVGNWLCVLFLATVIVLTQSKMSQVACGLLLLWNFWRLGKRSPILSRVLVMVSLLVTMVIFSHRNPISERFLKVFSEDNPARLSGYQDDRLAFWHAHWLMVEERWVFGHGRVPKEYLAAYYERIGLGRMVKNDYRAHNMYLQVLADGGVVALVFFLAWLWSVFKVGRGRQGWIAEVTSQTVVLFMLAGFVQNSFQDASVRVVVTVGVSLLFIADSFPRRNPAGRNLIS